MVPLNRRSTLVAGFLPWAGLSASFLGLAIVHQWGSDGVFDSCPSYPPAAVGLILLLGLAIAVAGALGSLMVVRRDASVPRRFIAMLSLGAACLFALAMVLPFTASLIIPICFG
ncbi:MAG: hypothetical protein ABR588_04860 [Sphingomicrobium sp.]|nr:hypothetical protein [Sphingomonadales bacterium]